MKPLVTFGWQTTRWLGSSLWSFAVWSAWLGLLVLLCLQLWWFRSSGLDVPGFVLRAFETRLAASDLHASFGRAIFDPTGRILLEDFRLSTPAFREPIATARMIYVRLDPWALATGDFEPEELQLSGVSLYEPAMLSATGRSEPVIRDLEATLALRAREIELRQLHTRIGPIGITATGVIPIPEWQRGRDTPLPVGDYLARDYPRLSHEISTWLRQLDRVEGAELRLDLTPSDAHGVIVEAGLLATTLRLDRPFALAARNLRLAARFPFGNASVTQVQLEVTASELVLPGDTRVAHPRGRIRGALNLVPGQWGYVPDEVEASAQAVTAGVLPAPLGDTYVRSTSLMPILRGRIATELAGTALVAEFDVDPAQKSATASVRTRVTPDLVPVAGRVLGRDVGAWLELHRPVDVSADLRLDPGWRFAAASGRLDGEDAIVRGVPLDEVRGRIALDGTALAASEIVLRTGPSEARGSYTMDTASRDFRFLLGGRLEPAAISPWFRDWWTRLFANFDFTAALPSADVDVAGRWGAPALTTVFLGIEADSPRIRGVPLDRVRTVLFIRPQYFEARELAVRHRGGSATGTFARASDPVTREPRRLDFAVDAAGIDPVEVAGILGDTGRSITAPFRFAAAPDLKVAGRLDYEPGTAVVRPDVRVSGTAPGIVEVFDFPVENVRFTAEVKDDAISVQPDVDFAGGKGTGRVWLDGRGEQRRLRFDYALKGAKLGPVTEVLEGFSARRSGTPRGATSEYVLRAADVVVEVSASAEGPAANPYGLTGRGQADLTGARLGEVPLLGPLSEIIPVLSLRFTRMQGAFEIDGPWLRLPDAKVTGANSGIVARGAYNLQTRALAFNGRVFPFSESQNPLQALADLLTRPLSNLFEVQLGGTLGQPAWSLAPALGSRDPSRTAAPAGAPPTPVLPAE